MSIRFQCRCGRDIVVHDDNSGRRGKCPACGSVFIVPPATIDLSPVASIKPKSVPPKAPTGTRRWLVIALALVPLIIVLWASWMASKSHQQYAIDRRQSEIDRRTGDIAAHYELRKSYVANEIRKTCRALTNDEIPVDSTEVLDVLEMLSRPEKRNARFFDVSLEVYTIARQRNGMTHAEAMKWLGDLATK